MSNVWLLCKRKNENYEPISFFMNKQEADKVIVKLNTKELLTCKEETEKKINLINAIPNYKHIWVCEIKFDWHPCSKKEIFEEIDLIMVYSPCIGCYPLDMCNFKSIDDFIKSGGYFNNPACPVYTHERLKIYSPEK